MAFSEILPSELSGAVDFAVISITPDEEKAINDRFDVVAIARGERCSYGITFLYPREAEFPFVVALVKLYTQANSISQSIVDIVVRELSPKFVALCGICGGYLDEDFGFGDVIFGTRVVDPRVGAVTPAGREVSNRGGDLHPEILKLASGLTHLEKVHAMADWATHGAITMNRPSIDVTALKFDDEVPELTRKKFIHAIQHQAKYRAQPIARIGADHWVSRLT